jgi:phosphoenolpyruvate synthase/pyruvate phosphate dikinase
VVLVRLDTSTAHAALVARQMGKRCIIGCAAVMVNGTNRSAQMAGTAIKEDDWLSINVSEGTIYLLVALFGGVGGNDAASLVWRKVKSNWSLG